MESLAQTTFAAPDTRAQRRRFVGWTTLASGVALIIVGEKPFFPASFSPFILIASSVLFLGMLPVASWLANGTRARAERSAVAARIAEWTGFVGVFGGLATAILALPHWLPAVSAQVLETSSFGVIGAWLLLANVLAFRARLINRVLAILGAIAGLGFILGAAIMWVALIAGDLGSAVSTLEGIRMLGGYLGQGLYIIWALWLGIWLLVQRK